MHPLFLFAVHIGKPWHNQILKFLSQNSESEMKNIHWMQDHLTNVSTIIVLRQKTPPMQQNL